MPPYVKDTSTRFASRYRTWHDNYATPYPPYRLGTTRTLTRILNGNTNPKWRDQVAAGQNATTAMTATSMHVWQTKGFLHHNYRYDAVNGWNGHGTTRTGAEGYLATVAYATIVPATFGWFDGAEEDALARVYQTIRKKRVHFSAPTFLGELRDVMSMIRRPAQALRKRCDLYKDKVGKVRRETDNRSWLNRVGGLWLEEAFGWEPLLHDMKDAQSAWKSLFQNPPLTYFSEGAAKSRLVSESTSDYSLLPGAGAQWTKRYVRITERVTVRYKGAIRAANTMANTDTLARFGFTPSEFVPTAWELLPWSFLIDYFTNVGEVLSSVVTNTDDVAWVNRTDRRTSKHLCVISPNKAQSESVIPVANRGYFNGRESQCAITRTWVTRSVGVGLQPPMLRFKFPAFESNPWKWCNIAALMAAFAPVHPQTRKRDPAYQYKEPRR